MCNHVTCIYVPSYTELNGVGLTVKPQLHNNSISMRGVFLIAFHTNLCKMSYEVGRLHDELAPLELPFDVEREQRT